VPAQSADRSRLPALPSGSRPANFRFVEDSDRRARPGRGAGAPPYLSLDPYMRGRLSDAKSYAKPQELGAVMGGGTVGEVVASNNPRFKPGEFVVGMGGWQLYSLSDGAGLASSTRKRIPMQAYLGRSACPASPPGMASTRSSRRRRARRSSSRRRPARSAPSSANSPSSPARGRRHRRRPGEMRLCAKELGYDACVDHKSPTSPPN
jgi:NADPH-dependent curcumin reductase CurA